MRSSHLILLSLIMGISIFFFREGVLEQGEYLARVVSTDNKDLIQRGVSRIGAQNIGVEILTGDKKYERMSVINRLNGSAEYDEYYETGDKLLMRITEKNQRQIATPVALYRIPILIKLLVLFSASLILYAGRVGAKSLFSFIASVGMIYHYLIPRILEGESAMGISLIFITALTGIIVFSVAGITERGVAAFLGTITGLLTACIMTHLFMGGMSLSGLTLPMSQALISSGNFQLNLPEILYSGIIISASGAAMDVAMDMAVSMEEILGNSPEISRKNLIKSGFNIGSAVIGTMSTTLLLAYTGGNITMMMLMADRGLSLSSILNSKLIAVEVAKTLIGTTSLLIVAPVTALIAAFIYMRGADRREESSKELVKQS